MLPTKKTPPRAELADQTVLVYGRSKIGKTTWCAQADGALFLATEAGLNHVEAYQVPITTWDDLLLAAKEIADGKHEFKTIVLDTIDNAYRMCNEYICRKFKVDHPSDLPYGKGFSLVNNELYRVLNKLSLLPCGLYLISHSQEIEVETRTGKFTKVVPTLPDKARKIVLGMVDIILYCDLETVTVNGKPNTRRVCRTTPNKFYEAGHRNRHLPETIDLDYARFVEAFRADRSDAPAPRATKARNVLPRKTQSTQAAQHA